MYGRTAAANPFPRPHEPTDVLDEPAVHAAAGAQAKQCRGHRCGVCDSARGYRRHGLRASHGVPTSAGRTNARLVCRAHQRRLRPRAESTNTPKPLRYLNKCAAPENRADPVTRAKAAANETICLRSLGQQAQTAGDFAAAEKYFAQAVALSPADANAQSELAAVQKRRGTEATTPPPAASVAARRPWTTPTRLRPS